MKEPVPEIPEMEAQLLEQMWRQKSRHIWVSPQGQYCVGVRDAWLAMNKSPEFASTMSKGRPRKLSP